MKQSVECNIVAHLNPRSRANNPRSRGSLGGYRQKKIIKKCTLRLDFEIP